MLVTKGFSQEPNDCQFSLTVCGNSNLSIDVNGIGVQELSGSNTCSSSENNSIWLQVNIATAGTLGFILTPASNAISEDYDFFVFGPNVSCGNIGQAIRCSTTNPLAAGQGNNLTGMNSTETDTSEGPGPDGNSFVRELDVLAGESYFIVIDRPIGNSPFSLQWTGTATFPENPLLPVAPDLFDLSICDNILPNDDGIAEFNVSDITNDIIASDSDLEISYHLTESDANIDVNSLGTNFQNTTPFNQDIFIRIENGISGCYIIESLSLSVNPGPFFNQPSDFQICDDLIDGDNSNGLSSFNLDLVTSDITSGFNPADLQIAYFLTNNDAQNQSNALPNSIIVSDGSLNELFVRIENDEGCIYVTSFFIEVLDVPTAINTSIFQCDEFGSADGITLFNLRELDNTVSPTLINTEVNYFQTRNDAISNLNSVDADNFINNSNPQIIYARVQNSVTGCYNIAEITLEASNTGANNAILNVCDTDGIDDGFTSFDLSEANSIVLSGLPQGLNIAYYDDLNDALLEQNVLTNMYSNSVANNQIIYARVEDNNNCYGIAEVTLNVLLPPEIETFYETYYCLNNFPEPIVLTGGVLNDLPNNYTYEWSTGETTNEILVNAPGTYTVNVFNNAGCFKERTIRVLASNIATITNVEVIDVSESNSISFTVAGEGDYEFALNSINGPYQDTPFFDDLPPNVYTLYVRDKNGCGVTEQIVPVLGFPKFFTPNGDGNNDFWKIKGVNSREQIAGPIRIYNRFGKLITEVDPLSQGWDGTYNGNLMPSNDYWFTVTLQDGREFTSHFSLKR